MARYLEDDPFMQAAASLVEDVKIKAAEEAGQIMHMHPGEVYFVGDDGELALQGDIEDLTDSLAQVFEEAYAGNPDPLPADYYADED